MARIRFFCALCFGLAILVSATRDAGAQVPKGFEEALDRLKQATNELKQPSGDRKFEEGEEVDIEWFGKTYPARVAKIISERSGLMELKFNVDGKEQTTRAFPRDSRVHKRAGNAPAAANSATATSTPVQPSPKEYPVRSWSDSSGKFKIDASFAGQNAAGVQLKKSDGSVIAIGLDKLSKEDQAYVQGLADANPVNPFETAATVSTSAPAATKPVPSGTDREANWKTAQRVAIQPKRGAWSLTPDPAAPFALPGEASVIRLSGTGDDVFSRVGGGVGNSFENPRQILFDPSKGSALVVLVNAPPNAARQVRLIQCDLKSGRTSGEIKYDGSSVPVDVSPSGNLVIALPDSVGGQTGRAVEISKLEGRTTKLTRRWNMGDFANHGQRFDQAYFIGEDKLLGWSSWGGVASLWNIDTAECLWSVNFTAHTTPALSPGRQQLALAADDGVSILDTATGDTLAQFDANVARGSFAFSPDGKRFGCLSMRHVEAWDLTTGKQTHEVWFPKQMRATALDFLGGNFVLVDERFLVDLGKRIVLWEYQTPTVRTQKIAALAGGKYWYLRGRLSSEIQLASTALPDAAAKSKSDSLTADSVLAFRPGASVSLSVNLPGATDDEQRRATKNLTDKLRANGMVVADNAPFSLEATITDAGSESITYRRFHFESGGEQASVNKQMSVLSLKENGKEIWAATGSFGAPLIVHLKRGQSVQDAANEQKANPARFFLNADVPKFLARHPDEGVYGKSQLK